MKKILLLTAIATLVLSSISFGEIVSRVLTYNGPGSQIDKCTAIAQDINGRVYATGVSWGGSTTKDDYATIKFSEDGDFLWVARYDGPGHNLDHASAIAIDINGNVYVTGWSRAGSDFASEDYATIKYSPTGQQLWVKRYNGTGNCYDEANAIWVDAAGNVYVTGFSYGGSGALLDYTTVKYSPSGTELWVARYNGPSGKDDNAISLSLDGAGNVYVTGYSFQTNKGNDMLTIKYNNSGVQQWTARYDGPSSSDDIANEIKVDINGNAYITGSSHGGASKLDYATIKYNTSGIQQWLKRFNGASNDTDAATGLDLDVYSNVYVTGYSKSTPIGTSAGYYDYYTLKYNTADGGSMWANKYDGGMVDKAWDIKVVYKGCAQQLRPFGDGDIPCWDVDIYVSGQSDGIGTSSDFLTIRYSEEGTPKWRNRFNGPTNGSDAAFSISALNASPIIYAGGSFASDYGVVGITEERINDRPENFNGHSTSYPNPFNPETNISFRVERETNVKIIIFDMLGREVTTLVDRKLGAGVHSVSWNASNLNSGIYFYRYETAYSSETKKLVLVK